MSVQTMEAVDVTRCLVNWDGIKMQDRTPHIGEDGEITSEPRDVTLRFVICEALLSQKKDERIEGLEKLTRWSLAKKVAAEDHINFTSQETAKILKLVDGFYNAQVYGQLMEILDPTAYAKATGQNGA